MFTIPQREVTRDALVAAAHADTDVIGAAFVGSSATGAQDAWSDIDLMLQLAPGIDEPTAVARWTQRLYADHGAVHHLDVWTGDGVRYRVFLTAASLQIDLSFWPSDRFGARGERFRLIFGEPNQPTLPSPPDLASVIGTGWLYALHVRAAIARDTPWYALTLLDALRGQVITLVSVRHGLNPQLGREMDRLPQEMLTALAETRAISGDLAEIHRAFTALMAVFAAEIAAHDADLAARVQQPLRLMTTTHRTET